MNDYTLTDLFDPSSIYWNGALDLATPPGAVNTFLGQTNPSAQGAGSLLGNITIEDGYLQSSNYVAATTGWRLTPTSGDLNFAISVDTLDIPDTTTANSFHVDIDGDTWWGATTLGAAVASVTKAGVGTFTDIVATGTINATGGYAGSATALVYESTGINTGTTGHVRGGQTAYNTGTGFFLGYESAAYKFSIGNPASEYLTWDGTNLEVTTAGITKLMTAGATINGATLPVPIYVLTSDGEVYAADANASGTLKFFGFAISNSTDGNSIKVRVSGVVTGFSGLTIGSMYYVSDTIGTISVTPGTVQIQVGMALSATEILIIPAPTGGLVAGSETLASANTERSDGTDVYVKVKELQTIEGGTFTISFELATSNGADTAYGRIYKNAVAFGTEQSTLSTTYVVKSENLAFVPGDLIQLYIKSSGTSDALTQNFLVKSGGRNPILVITN